MRINSLILLGGGVLLPNISPLLLLDYSPQLGGLAW